MDFSVRMRNSNMVMGNIKEMNPFISPRAKDNKDDLIDFLFEPRNQRDNFDSFKKI